MNARDISVLVAEALGYNPDPGLWICKMPGFMFPRSIPEYGESLDAMHQAVNQLNDNERRMFKNYLHDVVCGLAESSSEDDFYVANATAYQRAKAFLITKGQWKESYGPAVDATGRASTGRADARELRIKQLEEQNHLLNEQVKMLETTKALETEKKTAACSNTTYSSDQATNCAGCGTYKHTPLRRDEMGGYVCLICIDKELDKHLPHD